MDESDNVMKMLSRACILVFFAAVIFPVCFAGNPENGSPLGKKDGVEISIRLKEPVDLDHPTIICELRNTTGNPIPFRLYGTAEGSGLVPRLFDKTGKEIERTEEWKRLYETGDSIHVRYGVLRPGVVFGPIPIELDKAYGEKWKLGVRLEIVWNPRETQTGPGPFGGQFGVGSGVKGIVDLAPLIEKVRSEQETGSVNQSANEVADELVSVGGVPERSSKRTLSELPMEDEGAVSKNVLWWIAGGVFTALALWLWLRNRRP